MRPNQLDVGDSASASAENWQSSCRDFAESGKPFAIQGFNADHWEFFEALRREFHYELRPVMSKVIFVPLESADAQLQ